MTDRPHSIYSVSMTLKKAQPRNKSYDWTLLAEACVQNPGEWIAEDDPDRPTTTPHSIRHGIPKVFEPAGAYEAINRKKEGLFVRYVGVPLKVWDAWDVRTFATLERTFDPDRFPDETPTEIVDFLTLHTPPKIIKAERKKLDNPRPIR